MNNTPCKPPGSRPNETGCAGARGTVIFIVLVFILTVTALVLISITGLRSEVDFVEHEFQRLRAYTQCVSGMEYLKNRVLTNLRGDVQFTDMLGRPLSPELRLDGGDVGITLRDILRETKYRRRLRRAGLGDMTFYISLQDGAGLLNVFTVERQFFQNLFTHHQLPPESADVLLDSLHDWMDPDHFRRPKGAESEFYLSNYGYSAANRLPGSQTELMPVQGMDREIFNVVGHLLDFDVESRGINPNTMPEAAFYIFKGLNPAKIRTIIDKRRETPFAGAAALTLAAGYNFSAYPKLFQFFTSGTTYVKIKAQMDQTRYFHISFRMQQISGGGSMRSSRRKIIGPGTGDRNPEEDFFTHFHFLSFREGTSVMDDDYR